MAYLCSGRSAIVAVACQTRLHVHQLPTNGVDGRASQHEIDIGVHSGIASGVDACMHARRPDGSTRSDSSDRNSKRTRAGHRRSIDGQT